MEEQLAREIIACLPKGRTRFDYFHNRYAAMLLTWKVGGGVPVAEIKKSDYAGLLDKPLIRQTLAKNGRGWLDAETLGLLWQEPSEPYLLTLSIWNGRPRWAQTTRMGVNLVLQMNFTYAHRKAFMRLVDPKHRNIHIRYGHPVRCSELDGRDTMAWARLDLDMQTGEALIEEIQNDWLRAVVDDYRFVQRRERLPWYYDCDKEAFTSYYNEVIQPHLKHWDEAMLAATLWFLREELGFHKIWYHDYETGRKIKRIGEAAPPFSIYTRLPKKFCFRPMSDSPEFLQHDRAFRKRYRKIASPRWQYLEL